MADDGNDTHGPRPSPLLGSGSPRGRLNSFPLWQNVLILLVVFIGIIYAAPNLYQPDPAVQIRSINSEVVISARTEQRVADLLANSQVEALGMEMLKDSLLVQVADDQT